MGQDHRKSCSLPSRAKANGTMGRATSQWNALFAHGFPCKAHGMPLPHGKVIQIAIVVTLPVFEIRHDRSSVNLKTSFIRHNGTRLVTTSTIACTTPEFVLDRRAEHAAAEEKEKRFIRKRAKWITSNLDLPLSLSERALEELRPPHTDTRVAAPALWLPVTRGSRPMRFRGIWYFLERFR